MSNSNTSLSPNSSISGKTFSGFGNLVKLLPTGTVFIFQFLNPVLTNTGQCSIANKVLTSILIALCGFSCAFSCFTDSYRGSDGLVHYGVVMVNRKTLLVSLPAVIGAISGTVFMAFPNSRHGMGYPPSDSS
ncbi:hypothetical protein V6N11_054621 [Hibiscus sabdariffa]|uniref:Uncharacterized protein n=1 Tax=Hibiscus sabdariffa TaxID=183260 RepID=A0ABR2S4M5_9ROSI